jgi:hypothetical protein
LQSRVSALSLNIFRFVYFPLFLSLHLLYSLALSLFQAGSTVAFSALFILIDRLVCLCLGGLGGWGGGWPPFLFLFLSFSVHSPSLCVSSFIFALFTLSLCIFLLCVSFFLILFPSFSPCL